MKAIRTRYYGPTNTKGSKIVATDADGNKVSISYPYELDGTEAHELAAYLLMKKMDWRCVLAGGGFNHDMFWVMLPVALNQVSGWRQFAEQERFKVYFA